MNYTEIMVRYGELSTKGKNRFTFIQRLAQNVRQALVAYPEVKIYGKKDRMHLVLNGADPTGVCQGLTKIFGIQNFSPMIKVPKDLEIIKATALELMKEAYEPGLTFKVNTKRADHNFELDTNALNLFLGNAVFDVYPEIQAQMRKPDITLRVEIRKEGAYLSYLTVKGAGGLPVGTSGRGMLMLSGGIDSPVAGFLAMKRGVEIEAVHFASPPYTSVQALKKAQDLTAKLAPYVGTIQFIEVPFTEIQEEIKNKVPQGYLMTITRRFMMRITDEIKNLRHGLVIINGESLGQVASQTLPSMVAINEVTNTPIIRPVVTMDKIEIIDLAEKIDTFQLSIQPFEDCCTIFAPPQPKTKPQVEKVQFYESRLDVEGLVLRAVEKIIVSQINVNGLVNTPENASAEKDLFDDLL
ncbi:tRNA uracil 4-sulfurtransferase ThiI [Enterococcus timonensis]|uniref:tRNA uracil 4-sulfurtransferase ThiI n=1 Tax=Enterococcus timonensis TaxID=1852364 RepID=UPI0008DAF820|nr:tRNA uracil 4-sulfurtransferase ThiI [Enterococcus timonensis]